MLRTTWRDWIGLENWNSFQLLSVSQLFYMQYPLLKSTQKKKIHILLKANAFHCEPELVSNLI